MTAVLVASTRQLWIDLKPPSKLNHNESGSSVLQEKTSDEQCSIKIPNWILIIPNMMGRIIPELIINQQGFEHCSDLEGLQQILEVHNLCRDDEVVLHVLARRFSKQPPVFKANLSGKLGPKFRPSKPPTCLFEEINFDAEEPGGRTAPLRYTAQESKRLVRMAFKACYDVN